MGKALFEEEGCVLLNDNDDLFSQWLELLEQKTTMTVDDDNLRRKTKNVFVRFVFVEAFVKRNKYEIFILEYNDGDMIEY